MASDDAGRQPDRLEKQFREEVRILKSGDQWRRWLDTAITFQDHDFANLVLIAAQRPEATRIADAKTWHSLGRHVAADEEAILLLSHGSKSGGSTTSEVKELWDVSQTFGEQLPASFNAASRRTGNVPDGLWSRLSSIAAGLGFHVSREPLSPPDLASVVDYGDNSIVIAGDFNDGEAIAMLAHELAHVVMHTAYVTGPGDKVQSQELLELEAMKVQYLIVKPHGITREPDFDVVTSWVRSVDPRDVEQKVQELADHVLTVARPIMDATSTTALAVENMFIPARRRHLIVVPSKTTTPEPPIDRGP